MFRNFALERLFAVKRSKCLFTAEEDGIRRTATGIEKYPKQ
jgi:hypothetical protein